MQDNFGKYCIIDGLISLAEESLVKVDPGKLAIYEVVRIQDFTPIFVSDHIERLMHSAALFELKVDISYTQFLNWIKELIAQNSIQNGKLKIICSPNEDNVVKTKDTVLYIPKFLFPTEKEYAFGVKLGILESERVNPNAKKQNSQTRRRSDIKLAENGVYELLLEDHEGYLTEGSRSNFFYQIGDDLFTPPRDNILPGIARKNIIKSCGKEGINIVERKLHIDELNKVVSMFLSGTSPKVLPVGHFGDIAFDVDSTILRKVMAIYEDHIANYIQSFTYPTS